MQWIFLPYPPRLYFFFFLFEALCEMFKPQHVVDENNTKCGVVGLITGHVERETFCLSISKFSKPTAGRHHNHYE